MSDAIVSKKLKLIGLTGSLASGKSLAAEIFSQLGATIIDADLLAKEAVAPGSEGLRDIVKRFGSEI